VDSGVYPNESSNTVTKKKNSVVFTSNLA